MRAEWSHDKRGEVRVVVVELTDRNLRALLAMREGNPPDSECTIWKEIDGALVYVRAVPNDEHYSDATPPGAMHEDTERSMLMRALDDPKVRGGLAFSSGPDWMARAERITIVVDGEERVIKDRHRPPMDYCSEGAYHEPTEEECARTCSGFSQCRDLGCQKLPKREPGEGFAATDLPNDLHQGV